MRKVLAVALAALQLLFIVGLIAYQGVINKNLSEHGTEYEFAAEGNYWVIGDDRRLTLEIRKSAGYVYYTGDERYWEIHPLTDGRRYVRGVKSKPQDDPYIAIPDRDDWDKVNLSVSLPVSEAFERQYFPALKGDYFRENGLEDDGAFAYGTDDITDKTFSIKATVWNGHIRFDDYRIDGESIAGYLLPEGDHDA